MSSEEIESPDKVFGIIQSVFGKTIKAVVSSTGQCNTFASIDDNKVARNEKATRSHDTSRSQDYLARLACW